jgi:hypothetical protein
MSQIAPSGLRRLLYVSRSRLPGDAAAVAAALAAILATARRCNAELDVTGALLLRGGRFAQALEGPSAAVQAVFDRIAADPRHAEVTVTEDGPVAARAFPAWSMAYAGEEGAPDIPLTLVDAVREPGPLAEAVLQRLRAMAA